MSDYYTLETLPSELIVCVTPEDMSEAVMRDGCNCPAARALKRIYPPSYPALWEVDTDRIRFCCGFPTADYDTPSDLANAIRRYDAEASDPPTGPGEFPGTFVLRASEP